MDKFVISFACASVFAVAAASAATPGAGLVNVSGKVMVDQGKGFAPAEAATQLSVGDRVFVGQDSIATLNYGECSFDIKKPTIYSVTATAPCSKNPDQTASITEAATAPAAASNVVITPAAAEVGFFEGFDASVGPALGAGAAIGAGALIITVLRPVTKP